MAVPAIARRPDPPAAVVALVVALLGVLGFGEELGITADTVATVLGTVMAFSAGVRAWLAARAAQP